MVGIPSNSRIRVADRGRATAGVGVLVRESGRDVAVISVAAVGCDFAFVGVERGEVEATAVSPISAAPARVVFGEGDGMDVAVAVDCVVNSPAMAALLRCPINWEIIIVINTIEK